MQVEYLYDCASFFFFYNAYIVYVCIRITFIFLENWWHFLLLLLTLYYNVVVVVVVALLFQCFCFEYSFYIGQSDDEPMCTNTFHFAVLELLARKNCNKHTSEIVSSITYNVSNTKRFGHLLPDFILYDIKPKRQQQPQHNSQTTIPFAIYFVLSNENEI